MDDVSTSSPVRDLGSWRKAIPTAITASPGERKYTWLAANTLNGLLTMSLASATKNRRSSQQNDFIFGL